MPLVDSGTQSVRQGLIFLSPLILYPVIDFVFRIANGLIAPDLRSSFSLNAAELAARDSAARSARHASAFGRTRAAAAAATNTGFNFRVN